MKKIARALLILAMVVGTALAGFLPSGPAIYAREASPLPGTLSAVGPAAMAGSIADWDSSAPEARGTSRGLALLTGVGPTVPITPTSVIRFPAWYKAADGTALRLCLDAANCAGATPADLDPAVPGAAGEAFWTRAQAELTLPNGARALLTLALEAAFFNGPPVVGEEVSFSRVRVVARTALFTDGATYTVTHPFGTEILQGNALRQLVDPASGRFLSRDLGCAVLPCNFADPALMSADMGPFLRWDPAVAPAAPAGFIGDGGALAHPVIGSPTGNNFFRISGPEGVFTTTDFFITGQLAVAAADDAATVPVGATVPIDVLANDAPAPLTVSAVTAPARGTATVATVGASSWVTYTNTAGPTDVFTYTASVTGQPVTGTAAVNITTHAGNTAPVAVADAITVTINSTGTVLSVLANDVDAEGDLKFVSAVTQPAAGGTVAIGVAGTNVVFTPTAGFSGTTSFTYTASDGLNSSVGTTTVTVNTPPVAVADVVTVTANTVNNVINVLANDFDANGNPLSVSAVTNPISGTAAIGAGGANVLYTPLANSGGVDRFTYTVTDGAATATTTATVTVNRFPVAASDAVTVPINSSNNVLNVLANDSDPDGNPITISAVSQPARGTAAIGAGGTSIVYTPNAGIFGADPFTYTISDGVVGGVLTATAAVTATVDRPPVAGGDAVRIPFGSISNTITVLANDSDPDGNPVSVTDVSQPTHGTTAVGAGGTSVVYTPHTTFVGEGTFTYTLSDGNLTAPGTVTVTVHRGPAALSDFFRIPQNSVNNVLNVLANDADPEGDPISITSSTQPLNGVVSLGQGGTNIVYTPDAGFSGGDSFSYTVSDGQLSTTANVTIFVNRAPVAIADAVTLQRNSVSNPINVLGNDRDPDGDVVAVTAVTQPTSGAASVGPGGAVVIYTPNAGFTGTASFQYTISDGQLTATGTVVVTVPDQRAVNNAPLAVNDSVTVARNSVANVINVLVNDVDADGDSLVVIDVGSPAKGTARVDTARSVVIYTPNPGETGTDTFTYTVSDGALPSTAVINVTIPPNVAPLAANDTVFVPMNSSNNPILVLANDSDADGNVLTVTAAGVPSNGTTAVGLGGTTVLYSPRIGFEGTDSFNYSISDGAGGGANAVVTVTVHSLNHNPVALNDTVTVAVNSSANRIEVLANDSDPDGDPVAVAPVIGQPSTGTATLAPDRRAILYTPRQGFSGTDSFTYAALDGALNSNQATAVITVRGAKIYVPIALQQVIPGW